MGRPKKNFTPPESFESADAWIPDSVLIAELDISPSQKDRFDRDPKMAALGWPPKMKFGSPEGEPDPKAHNFRSRRQTEIFKRNVLDLAIKHRTALFEKLFGKGFVLPEVSEKEVTEAAE